MDLALLPCLEKMAYGTSRYQFRQRQGRPIPPVVVFAGIVGAFLWVGRKNALIGLWRGWHNLIIALCLSL
jgi:hypothetical protein